MLRCDQTEFIPGVQVSFLTLEVHIIDHILKKGEDS